MNQDQVIMEFDEVSAVPRPDWFGLVIDNRRLFDALQDGWLRPLMPDTNLLVGVNSYVRIEDEPTGNRIPVHVRVNTAKLPDIEVNSFRGNRWQSMRLSQAVASDAVVSWPGVLPVFAIRDLSVSTDERRVRLLSMARRISNIDVPAVSLECVGEEAILPAEPRPRNEPILVLPAEENSIRGALTMALWAVPRITPWIDVFVESLSSERKRLTDLVTQLEAGWWRYPPWSRLDDTESSGVQERLWLAAVKVLKAANEVRPTEILDGIAAIATQGQAPDDAGEIQTWRRATHAILQADATIQHDRWRVNPVGLAIQLVLSRPEPTAFKTWFNSDRVSLPPAVAWSAATLCGLLCGYRALDVRFRGRSLQREVIALLALQICSNSKGVGWPDVTDEPLLARRENDAFVLSWGGRIFSRKQQHERGKWYGANLGNGKIQRAAVDIARKNGWQCLSNVVSMQEGLRQIDGPGEVVVRERAFVLRGNVQIVLAPDDKVEEVVDVDAFRRMIVVEPGWVAEPPALPRKQDKSDRPLEGIPGLKLVQDFLTESEENEIVSEIDQNDWSYELKRRVQHYGWRYDYKSRQVDPSMRIGPLPEWAQKIARRLVDLDYIPELPDQLIVNEYEGNQGITPHIDSPSSFADGIAMISLLETWEMNFRKRGEKAKVIHKLEQRGVAVLTGEARYRWTHEIPKRKNEPGALKPDSKKPSRIPRHRRISLTFRKVIDTDQDLVESR